MNTAVMFSKASDEYETPQALFDELHKEFRFDIDVAATKANSKCEEYYTAEADALKWSWGPSKWLDAPKGLWVPTCWMNPPYSKVRAFIEKAHTERVNGVTTVALVPARTDTRWWHTYVWDASQHKPYPGVEVRFLPGRLKFGNSQNSAPFPSVVIVFRGAK